MGNADVIILSPARLAVPLGRPRGARQLLVPLPAESSACAVLRPLASDTVDFNFVVKRLASGAAVRPGPLDFDIRH